MSLVCSHYTLKTHSLKGVIKNVTVNPPSKVMSALRLFFIFTLAGCATAPPIKVNLDSKIHQQLLADKNTWLIKGKLGFKSPEKKQSANLRWQQQSDQYQLNLTSIIGTSLMSMRGNKDQVTLVADDKTYQDSDASHLIWRTTGWQIPVDNLKNWIKGQHQPRDKVTTSQQGWITELQPTCLGCNDWSISYDKYQLVGEIWLPHKVVLKNSRNNSQLLIRINQWQWL